MGPATGRVTMKCLPSANRKTDFPANPSEINMDTSVTAGAAILLDFIYRTETDKGPPACYDVIYGNRSSKHDAGLAAPGQLLVHM